MSSRLIRTLLAACLCWVVIARPAPAYYHFTHYANADGTYTPIVEKFDLDALLDRTVYFHVASASPRLAANDSYEGLVSQIRQALAVWNSVPTSSLRVAYAGTSDAPSLSRSPGGEIIFAELPPGVIGFGGPVTPLGDPKSGFVPIIRSQVILSNDLTQGSRPRPTFSEVFFTSLVHEIGHALGLQHTLTGSVMSTDVTRATTRALPLGADDIAGLSVLYPSPDFSQLNGALAGRVTTQTGAAVHMASVVAVGPNEQVVSALTAPDGAYRIDGLAPGTYRVYVHPLPPSTQDGLGPANIRLPTLLNNQPLSPTGPFKTVFLGGTNRPGESPLVEAQAGVVLAGIDFRVEPRGDLPLYNVTTFSFPGNGAAGVHPAFLDAVTEPAGFILATGPGLAEKAASLSVETLASGLEVRAPRLYEPDPRFIRVDFSFSPLTNLDPTHLVFRLPDDIYVLPSGVRLTAHPAPIVHWVALGEDEDERPVWFVRGANFDPRSAVYFDGWPAEVVSFHAEPEQIGVNPPAGVPGRPAVVTVYNPDGQSSAFTLPDGNVMFRFPDGPRGGISVSPTEAEVDSDVVIEISGVNATFVAGDTTIGFGSSDVVTRELYILSPNRALAVATVRSNAAPGTYKLTVTTGLEVLEAPGGFRVLGPGDPGGEPRVRFQSLVNSATMQPNLSPGVLASLYGRNLAVEGAGQVQVTFNGQAAALVSVSAGQINLQIPAGLTPGPVVMEVYNGVAKSKPMLAYLNAVSPGIFAVTHADGSLVAADNPVVPNETLVLVATGLGLESLKSGIDGLRISSGQQLVAPTKVEPVTSLPGVYVIYFQAPAPGSPGSPVFLWAAGERSNALALPLGTVAATAAGSP